VKGVCIEDENAVRYRRLQKSMHVIEKKQNYLRTKATGFSNRAWELGKQLSVLEETKRSISHKYDRGDFVVLEDGTVCKIERLVGAKLYKVFEYMGRRTGVERQIHEKGIVCCVQNIAHNFELKRKEAKP
jgi:hypothetical protein